MGQHEPSQPPAYPTKALPESLSSFVDAAARAIGCKPEMVAQPLIAAAGAAIGNRVRLELKQGWHEYPIVWCVVVAAPGTAKTPAASAATSALHQLQRAAYDTFRTRLDDFEAKMAQWEAAKPKDRGPKPVRPTLEHFLTTDATVEALAPMLAESPGILMERDELAALIQAMDAYRTAGDRQRYLEMWSGKALKVDRRSRDTLYVPNPVLCIAGGIQPDSLSLLVAEAGRDDGFLQRFFWAMPETEPARWTDAVIPDEATEAVTEIFNRLRPPAADRQEVTVRLSDSARDRFTAAHDEYVESSHESTGVMKGVYAKAAGQLARLALILHCTADGDTVNRPLGAKTMAAATQLMDYHIEHAHAALGKISKVGVLVRPLATRIRRAIDSAGADGITRSDLHAKLGGHVEQNALDEVLKALDRDGVARYQPARMGEGRGARGQRWISTTACELNETNELNATQDDADAIDSFNSPASDADGFEPDDLPPIVPAASGGDPHMRFKERIRV